MDAITEKTIDIEEVLRGKMGKKARWVPGFVVSWLKRIAHEDQCNEFLWSARDLKGTPWLEACLQFLDTKVEVEGSPSSQQLADVIPGDLRKPLIRWWRLSPDK